MITQLVLVWWVRSLSSTAWIQSPSTLMVPGDLPWVTPGHYWVWPKNKQKYSWMSFLEPSILTTIRIAIKKYTQAYNAVCGLMFVARFVFCAWRTMHGDAQRLFWVASFVSVFSWRYSTLGIEGGWNSLDKCLKPYIVSWPWECMVYRKTLGFTLSFPSPFVIFVAIPIIVVKTKDYTLDYSALTLVRSLTDLHQYLFHPLLEKLGKIFNLLMPWFHYLRIGNNIYIYSIMWRLNYLLCIKFSENC